MTKSIRVTLAQLNPVVGSLNYNIKKILKAWDEAPADNDLIIFSELIVTGYPPEDLVLKPFFMAKVKQAIDTIIIASAHKKNAALMGAPVQIQDKIYNAALLIESGEIIATILKHELPNYGVFDEHRIFSAGPIPIPVPFRGLNLGIMICEDMWTPAVSRALKDSGADVLITLNASPFESAKGDHRLEYARARVSETGLPLIYVNQTGGQDELVFDDCSFILNTDGFVILQGAAFEEGLYSETLTEQDKNHWLAVARTFSKPLESAEEIYRAPVLGLRDYVTKNNFPGVLLGLSGGIDSALSAAIAVDALGPSMVRGVMMPSQFTCKDSTEDAEILAQNLGIHLDQVPIEKPVQVFNEILESHFTAQTPSTTFENLQPRTRGMILMALSNATGFMVLSTGNKSEIAAGYATLYGDMCGGFNVLKDVYKTQVYELARWRNNQKSVIPLRSLTKTPTAELKPNQTDQDTLPPYEELDGILKCLIEEDLGVDDIVNRGYAESTVARVWAMLDRSEYKRRQAAPGVKITARAFGRDRRYPITNHFVNIIEKKGA